MENQIKGKNKVRVEIDMPEHKYWATDDDYDFLDLFILDGTEGYDDIRIYVDGQLIDFDDRILEEEFSEEGIYEKLEQWEDLENLGCVGYHDNNAHRVWEFEVENFDSSKLSLYWECYDLYFESYESEDRQLELRYDGDYVQENIDAYDCDEGDFIHIWPSDDDIMNKRKKKNKKDNGWDSSAAAFFMFS